MSEIGLGGPAHLARTARAPAPDSERNPDRFIQLTTPCPNVRFARSKLRPRAAEEDVSTMSDDVKKTIQETVEGNKVVLFMKGTKNFPQCGFSARSVEILKKCGAEFKDVNVLTDPAIRQGIKDYSNWPTIPQVYVNGKFIGGSDILMEMFQSGDLQKLLEG